MEKKNKQGNKDILEGKDILKFLKSLQLQSYGHVERTQNPRMSNCRSYNGGNKKKRNKARKMER